MKATDAQRWLAEAEERYRNGNYSAARAAAAIARAYAVVAHAVTDINEP